MNPIITLSRRTNPATKVNMKMNNKILKKRWRRPRKTIARATIMARITISVSISPSRSICPKIWKASALASADANNKE